MLRPQATAGYPIRPLTGFGTVNCVWCGKSVKKGMSTQVTCGGGWCRQGQTHYRHLLITQGREVAEAYKVKRIAERVKV